MLTSQSRKALRSLRIQHIVGDVLFACMTLLIGSLMWFAETPTALAVIATGTVFFLAMGVAMHTLNESNYRDYERRCVSHGIGFNEGFEDAMRCKTPRPHGSIDYRMGYLDGYDAGLTARPTVIAGYIDANTRREA
jgi:hypothetical protein